MVTLCEGIVFAPRPANALTLAVRRFFTRGYLADEARKIRGTRYDAARFVEADADMIDFFHWLIALPQEASPVPQPEPALV